MLSSIKEESKIDDVVFVIGDNNDLTYYSCIGSIFSSQSPVFSKLVNKEKKRKKSIHLKHMTSASFCFIRNSFYDLKPVLTYSVVVDVLYSSIKYEIKALICKCVTFLIGINNTNDYFTIIRSFSFYPSSLFESFFLNMSSFIINNIQQIISDSKLMEYSSLFTMNIFCEYILSKQLINDKECYDLMISWCQYQFNTKFKPLLSIKEDYNKYGEISVNGEKSESDTHSMITKWQDLFEDFIPLIDFVEIDIEYILVDIRSHNIMSNEDLLSILAKKYEYNKRHKISDIFVTDDMYLKRQKISDIFATDDMYLKRKELESLTIGSEMDLRDNFGRYLKAQIIERNERNRNKVKIHYIGWNKMWDKWIDIEFDHHLITKYGNITDRKIHKIQIKDCVIGDKVIIKLPIYHKHNALGWINAQIVGIDCGQLNVQYKLNEECDTENDIHEFWVHSDNIDECR